MLFEEIGDGKGEVNMSKKKFDFKGKMELCRIK